MGKARVAPSGLSGSRLRRLPTVGLRPRLYSVAAARLRKRHTGFISYPFSFILCRWQSSFYEQAVVGFGVLDDFVDSGDAVQDFEPAVLAKRPHVAHLHRALGHFPTANPVVGELPDFVRGDHQLVDSQTAAVARVATFAAADGFVDWAVL